MSTTDIAKKVIHFANEKKLPLLPNNYRVIFDYFAEKNELVKTSIDRHLKQKDKITQEILDEIYDNGYVADFADDTTVIMRREINAAKIVTKQASKVLAETLKQVITSSKENSAYGKNLDGYSKKAEKANSIDDIKNVIESMVKDTAEMTKKTDTFRKELESSRKQLSKLSEELEAAKGEARVDGLTGLYNRRHFDESLMGAIKYVQAENNCSLIILDIDHFKKFNDKYGHDSGDNLLKSISERMRTLITERCTICRYGGEEFAVICHGMSLQSAKEMAEKIRDGVWEWDFVVEYKKVPVTISLGVAEIRGDDDLSSPIQRADGALYLSKNSGRNTVRTEKEVGDAKKPDD
jgi:diguanylate cyclase